jgi:hypothetical protein
LGANLQAEGAAGDIIMGENMIVDDKRAIPALAADDDAGFDDARVCGSSAKSVLRAAKESWFNSDTEALAGSIFANAKAVADSVARLRVRRVKTIIFPF